MEYKSKEHTVEAIQWTGTNKEEILKFGGKSILFEEYNIASEMTGSEPTICLKILFPQGTMIVRKGDYLIKGIYGEFYFLRKEIFEKHYLIN